MSWRLVLGIVLGYIAGWTNTLATHWRQLERTSNRHSWKWKGSISEVWKWNKMDKVHGKFHASQSWMEKIPLFADHCLTPKSECCRRAVAISALKTICDFAPTFLNPSHHGSKEGNQAHCRRGQRGGGSSWSEETQGAKRSASRIKQPYRHLVVYGPLPQMDGWMGGWINRQIMRSFVSWICHLSLR